LVRAPALQAGGPRFEPATAHHASSDGRLSHDPEFIRIAERSRLLRISGGTSSNLEVKDKRYGLAGAIRTIRCFLDRDFHCLHQDTGHLLCFRGELARDLQLHGRLGRQEHRGGDGSFSLGLSRRGRVGGHRQPFDATDVGLRLKRVLCQHSCRAR
jgi:hypothetical protein